MTPDKLTLRINPDAGTVAEAMIHDFHAEVAENRLLHEGVKPVAFVQSENAARRQLSESQLAYAITHPNILEFERRRARERQEVLGRTHGNPDPLAPVGAKGDPCRTANVLAAKAGVGARSVSRAIKVREEGTPELNAAVAAGEIKLNMAEKIARLNPAAQKRVIEAPAARRGDEMQAAMNRSESCKRRGNSRAPDTVLPQGPGTPFARKFLSGIERLAMLCAEEGAKDGPSIATKFIDEMDWSALPLTLQLERAEPVIRALAIIQQHRSSRAA